MKCILYQPSHTIADFDSIRRDVIKQFQSYSSINSATLLIGPELLLCGYPLQDLCLQKAFYHHYLKHLELLESDTLQLPKNTQLGFILGGLDYKFDQEGIPEKITNVLYFATPGEKIQKIYVKILLPNDDIFDEKKYFQPGLKCGLWHWNNYNLGLMICEDMWGELPSKLLQTSLDEKALQLDAIINCSASPFHVGKLPIRIQRAKEISQQFQCPFIYVNRVGAEDEILFDGQSFFLDNNKTQEVLGLFKADLTEINLTKKLTNNLYHPTQNAVKLETSKTSWNQLFKPDLIELENAFHPSLRPWSEDECAEVLSALQFGLQEYARKCGMKNFLVALSGGIDSGLVLAITKLSLKPEQQVEAIFMPGLHSTELSMKLASEICQNMGIHLKHLPIKFLHTVNKNLFREHLGTDISGIADENLQSRLRGMLLYTRSNQTGSMVINTSNKSEISVGYSTQYGDSVGALSIIGDLYKTQVYQLCHFINQKYGPLIPKTMIERAPTAELRPNQTDEQSLLPYSSLDPLLECILSYRFSLKDLIQLGFEQQAVTKILNLYQQAEYKRRQFCPILKVRPKSFGFGYRVPICKNSKFYTTID